MNTVWGVVMSILGVLLFMFFNKTERFSLANARFSSKKAFQTITDKVQTSKKVKVNPTSPCMSFDDTAYVPAFYKVQAKFPLLTKKTMRIYNLEA